MLVGPLRKALQYSDEIIRVHLEILPALVRVKS